METHNLTKDDIKALRQATSVCFVYTTDANYIQEVNGHSCFLKAIKKVRTSSGDVWGGDTELQRIVPATVRTTLYDAPVKIVKSAYTSLLSCSVDPNWQTAVRFLKAGDELYCHFIAGNNSETLKNAGLSHDEFDLVLVRGKDDENPGKQFTFRLDDRICPSDSSARMVS